MLAPPLHKIPDYITDPLHLYLFNLPSANVTNFGFSRNIIFTIIPYFLHTLPPTPVFAFLILICPVSVDEISKLCVMIPSPLNLMWIEPYMSE